MLLNTKIRRVLSRFDHLFKESGSINSINKYDQYYKNYRRLIRLLREDETYLKLTCDDQLYILKLIITKYKLFYLSNNLNGHIQKSIVNESRFIYENRFWKIPAYLIEKWYNDTISGKIPFRKSYLYLSVLLLVFKFNSLIKNNKMKLPLIGQCSRLTGFSPKTVVDYLKDFKSDAIELKKDTSSRFIITVPDWFDNIEDKSRIPTLAVKQNNWGEPLAELNISDHIEHVSYLKALPFNNYNPFISFLHPNFYIHSDLISIDILILSLLNKDQLIDLHRLWVKRQYARSINSKYDKARKQLASIIRHPKTSCNNPHYRQIQISYPILNFIAGRRRLVDIERIFDLRSTYHVKMVGLKDRLINTISVIKPKVDIAYFIESLNSSDFFTHWSKRYEMANINPFSTISDGIPVNLAERTKQGVDEMTIVLIKEYQKLFRLKNELTRIWEYLHKHNTNILSSNYSCLEVKTHRITFRNFPIQNIIKTNRKIVVPKSSHLFLLADINSAELEIVKWFITKQSYLSKKDLQNLTFEKLSTDLKIPRDSVKSMFYPFIYGASSNKISETSGHNINIINNFINAVESFKGFSEFRKSVVNHAKNSKFSLPTALDYSFPIFGNPQTQSLVYTIQGTGAELLREWILEIFKRDLVKYISNIVHDEIIFELPEDQIQYIYYKIMDSFKYAVEKILPGSDMGLSIILSKTWQKHGGISANIFSKVP